MKSLRSSVFGTLKLDEEMHLLPAYMTDCQVPGYGKVLVKLVALVDDSPKWADFVRKAESTYHQVLIREKEFRLLAAPNLFALHNEYFESEWADSAEELILAIKLCSLHFFSNGCCELWYQGGEAFHDCEVRIKLDDKLALGDVGIEG